MQAPPECKLKPVNICEMHGTAGLEVGCDVIVLFDRFQLYVQIVRKDDKNPVILLLGNMITLKAEVRCEVNNNNNKKHYYIRFLSLIENLP